MSVSVLIPCEVPPAVPSTDLACLLLNGIVGDTPLRLGSVALISTYVRPYR